jgi:hypothetical protein
MVTKRWVVYLSRRKVVRVPVFEMRVYRALRMIGCVFDSLDDTGLNRLIAFRKFLDAFVGSVLDRGQALRVA